MVFAGDLGVPSRGGRAARLLFVFLHGRFARALDAFKISAVAAIALAGCGLSDGPGQLTVDPGRYTSYRCTDLVARWKALAVREKELRSLMDKASEGGGGTVIGTLAYRTDYELLKSDQKLLARKAAEKKCDLAAAPSDYQSDQSIR